MPSENRVCASCKNEFTIEPEDITFYERIQVPSPTLCPDCRQQRRYAWRNERVLYRRRCDLCGKSTVTIYSPSKPLKVYCPPCWWSDKWNATDYGCDFDFSRPFFEQFQELQLQVPRIALLTKNSVNSDYTHHSGENKNCYLCFGVFNSENVLYSTNMYGGPGRDCMECYHIILGAELLYECIDCEKCYNCQYGILLRDCNDCFYCYDCRGSSNCFMSWNLRKKQYCILNQQYSKEDYFKKIEEYNLLSFAGRQKLYVEWLEHIRKDAVHRFALIEKSVNVSGNGINNARNVHDSFEFDEGENARYTVLSISAKDSMDSYHFGRKSELVYESHGVVGSYSCLFSHLCYDNSHIEYCDTCHNSENLFGCVGIKKGSYSILNRQYDEQAYKELKTKIVAHMRETGEYGEFFPAALSPIGYNETQGQIYMPLTQEEVKARGWKWEEQMPGTFEKETLKPDAIPDMITDVNDSILSEVLACTGCNRNYNVVQPELQLYRRFGMPVPRLCPDCRYRAKIALRLPRKLWHRSCMCDDSVRQNSIKHEHHPDGPCHNEFETPYAPERPEIVYCEACYQAEVA